MTGTEQGTEGDAVNRGLSSVVLTQELTEN